MKAIEFLSLEAYEQLNTLRDGNISIKELEKVLYELKVTSLCYDVLIVYDAEADLTASYREKIFIEENSIKIERVNVKGGSNLPESCCFIKLSI